MSLLVALFLVVHAGVHIGYFCGQAWPFTPSDPWLVTGLGVSADTVHVVAGALVGVSFVAFVLAALSAVGLLPAVTWKPLVAVAAVSSAFALLMFVTPSTLPGLAIDLVLLWAVLVHDWRPRPLVGRAARGHLAPSGQGAR